MALEVKEFEIVGKDGNVKKFILSKIPAFDAFEIFGRLFSSGFPTITDHDLYNAQVLKLFKFISVDLGNGNHLALSTREFINSHVGDWTHIHTLVKEIQGYNTDFLEPEKNLGS